jgi:hypothetical protein
MSWDTEPEEDRAVVERGARAILTALLVAFVIVVSIAASTFGPMLSDLILGVRP